MVAPRSEPTPARGNEEKRPRDPQPAEADAVPPARPAGAWKAWLPLGVMVMVMPLVAYGVTTYILVPKMRKSLVTAGVAPAMANQPAYAGADGAGGEGMAQAGQGPNVTLNKLVVNVAGTMASRYLLTSIALVGAAPDFASRVAKYEPCLLYTSDAADE